MLLFTEALKMVPKGPSLYCDSFLKNCPHAACEAQGDSRRSAILALWTFLIMGYLE